MKKISVIAASAAMMMTPIAAERAEAQAPAGYYDALEGLSRSQLMAKVAEIVGPHTVIPYGSETWDAFKRTDVHFVNGRQAWWDMYSDEVVYTSSGHVGLNREHSVPNSWWGGESGNREAYCDIVNLNPSDETANQKKSNYPLGEVRNVTWTNGVSTIGQPKTGQGGGANYVFEPADEYKGDFARQYLYMFTVYATSAPWGARYDYMYDTSRILLLKDWTVELLLGWMASDPVSEKEINRNNAVYKVQRNRNPFVDLPHLASYIWGEKSGQPFELNPDTESGVTRIETGERGLRIYDLQGRECKSENPAPGIYIVIKDGKAEKIKF